MPRIFCLSQPYAFTHAQICGSAQYPVVSVRLFQLACTKSALQHSSDLCIAGKKIVQSSISGDYLGSPAVMTLQLIVAQCSPGFSLDRHQA